MILLAVLPVKSLDVIVNARPTAYLSGPDVICIGSITTLSPATGGVWDSADPSVASANASGIVTGLINGTTKFVFTDANTGCASDSTELITVNDIPAVSLDGPAVCVLGLPHNKCSYRGFLAKFKSIGSNGYQ